MMRNGWFRWFPATDENAGFVVITGTKKSRLQNFLQDRMQSTSLHFGTFASTPTNEELIAARKRTQIINLEEAIIVLWRTVQGEVQLTLKAKFVQQGLLVLVV